MKKAFILMFVLTLSACGWHLRGSIALPKNIESIYIESRTGNSLLQNTLSDLLQNNGATVQRSVADADLIISILDFKENRRVNSVNSNTIVREYELISEARYEVKNIAGEVLLEPNTTQLSRIYTFDQNAVVSASEEEKIIKNELRFELAQQIVRRLRFL